MTKSVSIAHLKAHLARVVGDVQLQGTSVVIEKRGRPVAMLVPIEPSRPAGLLGLVGAFDDAPGFPDILDEIVKGRRREKRRRVPRLT
jgi:prevent-host-death family protein